MTRSADSCPRLPQRAILAAMSEAHRYQRFFAELKRRKVFQVIVDELELPE